MKNLTPLSLKWSLLSQYFGIFFFSFLLPLFSTTTHAEIAENWKLINQANGVSVFSKTIQGSPIVAFKGEAVINASIKKVFWVLLDNDHRIEWVDRLKYNEILETLSPFEYVIYQEFKLPWPLTNRDFVYRGKASRDSKTGVVTLSLMSEPHDKAPKKKLVRAELLGSSYTLTPIESGKTKVEVEIHSDPKGAIPSWLVNLIQKSWPIKTLNGIAHQVTRAHAEETELPGPGPYFIASNPASSSSVEKSPSTKSDSHLKLNEGNSRKVD
jgi:hypothetical protein